jgi:hypothetical protein
LRFARKSEARTRLLANRNGCGCAIRDWRSSIERLMLNDQMIADRQSALANAALIARKGASAVGLERSFRRPAVTKAEQEFT